jgi:4-amino-4-deoxy-L-arabinose transferase-like glycosyltransferase
MPILFLSVLLRVLSAAYQGESVKVLPGVHDQISYHNLAVRVLGGHGFTFNTGWWPATRAGAPTAHWSYLYTLYLVLVYWFFGVNPLVARLFQAVIVGVLHPWLSWRIGARLSGERTGLFAALFSGVYAYFVYYSGSLITESFFVLATLWVLDLAMSLVTPKHGNSESRWQWIALGCAVGVAVLLRQVFLLFIPLLLGWLLFNLYAQRRQMRDVARGIFTLGATVLLLILPWTIRNYFAFRQFVLLNTNAGFAFFWANHPSYGSRFIPVLSDSSQYGAMIPDSLRELDEASLDRRLLKEGLRFVAQDPQRYFKLSLGRAGEYFKFWPSRDSAGTSNAARVLSFGIFLPFMILGIFVVTAGCLSRRSRDRSQPTSVSASTHVLLTLFIMSYTAIHVLTWALIRYRIPVDGVLILYAAAAVPWLADRLHVNALMYRKTAV